jgi:hypothetical protein
MMILFVKWVNLRYGNIIVLMNHEYKLIARNEIKSVKPWTKLTPSNDVSIYLLIKG